jgi:WD40 repeat protein
MKAELFCINFHADEAGRNAPINGIDYHPKYPLIATCSNDEKIYIWEVVVSGDSSVNLDKNLSNSNRPGPSNDEVVQIHSQASDLKVNVKFKFAIRCHQQPVNVVRFSPNGKFKCILTVMKRFKYIYSFIHLRCRRMFGICER